MKKPVNAYQQKLLDPRWQRRRLESLENADFHCEMCGNGNNTLHVHHKQYIKGREPWEYEVSQLCVLCKDCHESSHEEEDRLNIACSFAPIDGPCNREELSSLINGFLLRPMEDLDNPEVYVLGAVSRKLSERGFKRGLCAGTLHDWAMRDSFDSEELSKILSNTKSVSKDGV